MQNLIDKLFSTNDATNEELLALVSISSDEDVQYLFDKAVETREKFYLRDVYMRGLIEFTNYCKQNCEYCGIRRSNTNVDRYRLEHDDVIACCDEGYRLGYRTFVLQGGEDAFYTDDVLVKIIKDIKEKYSDVAITVSIGERSKESYQKLRDAGVDRYLLRHETASKKLYESLHPEMSFENRQQCLNDLKEVGFQIGAGFMVGLPNQTPLDLVKDLRFLKDLQPHMVGIGPYLNHPDTPLKDSPNGSLEQTLIMLALTRLLLPDVLLPSTTALGTLDKQGREKALKAGANVVMPNLSPMAVREKYELYKDKICTGDEAAHCRKCIEGRILSAGFQVNMSRGDHVTRKRDDEVEAVPCDIVNLTF